MKYRAEIDGLRALAVIPVILFHAGFEWFSGGFVGVDVFFVISGYLITTIIIEDLDNERFSIKYFYERRARRILPSLIVMLFLSSFAAILVLPPNELLEFYYGLLSTLGFVSNFYFWTQDNYFAQGSELSPLLHTWSLAIEEQFYIFLPIFLYALRSLSKGVICFFLILLTIGSFSLSVWASLNTGGSANFFFPVTRFWELLVGSILALKPSETLNFKHADKVGFLLLLIAIFGFDKNVSHPGFLTLIPVIGTALLIGSNARGFVHKFLSLAPMIYVGSISYALYLFHQPIFSFYRNQFGVGLSFFEVLGLLILTFFVSIFVTQHIEKRFRDKKSLSVKKLVLFIFCSFAFFVGLFSYVVNSKGFIGSYDFEIVSPPEWETKIPCHGPSAVNGLSNPLVECLGGSKNGKGSDFFVIGDSHAAQLYIPISKIALNNDLESKYLYFDTHNDFHHSFYQDDVYNDRTLDHLLTVMDKGDLLVMSFHAGWLNRQRDNHLSLGINVNHNDKSLKMLANLKSYISKFEAIGAKVILVLDVPLLPANVTSMERCFIKSRMGQKDFCAISREQIEQSRRRQELVFKDLSNRFQSSVILLDPLDVLLESTQTFYPIDDQNRYLMRDRHHLTEYSALKLGVLFEDFVTSSK